VNPVVTDIELIHTYDQNIGRLYSNAKNFYKDAPIQTLVLLRSILEELVPQLLEEYSIECKGKSLHDMTRALEGAKEFSPHIITHMHTLRDNGNTACHKNQHDLTHTQFSKLALDSLIIFCDLIQDIWLSCNAEKKEYTFVEVVNNQFYKLSYQALFENDPDAKFVIGIAMFDKHQDKSACDSTEINNDHLLKKAIAFVEEAAINQHAEAMFEYGCLLVQGIAVKQDLKRGIGFLHSACKNGFNKAAAHHAISVFTHKKTDPTMVENAIKFLLHASKKGDAHAQFVLSERYKDGEGIEINNAKSEALLLSAVKAENSHAIFQYGKQLIKAGDLKIESGEPDAGQLLIIKGGYYVSKAANNHLSSALLYVARRCVTEGDSHNAEEWFDRYFELCSNDYEAQFEYAYYLYKQENQSKERIRKALISLSSACIEQNCPAGLIDEAKNISPKWLDRYSQLSPATLFNSNDLLRHTKLFMLFDINGRVIDNIDVIKHNVEIITDNISDIKRYTYTPNLQLRRSDSRLGNKIGRNDFCYCQSGKKYKKCCG